MNHSTVRVALICDQLDCGRAATLACACSDCRAHGIPAAACAEHADAVATLHRKACEWDVEWVRSTAEPIAEPSDELLRLALSLPPPAYDPLAWGLVGAPPAVARVVEDRYAAIKSAAIDAIERRLGLTPPELTLPARDAKGRDP